MKVLLILLFCLSASADIPFWKRPEVYDTMLSEKRIVVSANTGEITEGAKTLQTMGVVVAGIVNAPYNFTSEQVQKYEELKQISTHFEEVRFNPTKNTLFLHMSALGYHVRMALKLEVKKSTTSPASTEILWESVEGGFVGMKGVIRLEDYDRRRTEISLTASHKTEKLPLPKALVGLGLEIVARKVAENLRAHIETEHKKLFKKVP